MSAGLGPLMITIGVNTTALTNATKQMQLFAASTTSAMNSANASVLKFGNTMTKVGKGMTTSLSLPLALVGGGALKMSADFEYSLAMIEGLVGIAREQVQAWGEDLKKLAVEFGVGPAKLADALYFVTSSGIRGAEAMEIVTMSAKASATGLGEVKVIADAVSSAVNAYGKANLSAAQATDILVAAVREGKGEADEFAHAIGKVIPAASIMGVSFDQTLAAMAAMTRIGTDAGTSAIQLRQMLNSLQKPSVEAESQMALMGTSAAQLRKIVKDQGLLKGMQTILDLTDSWGSTIASKIFPNIRAMTGFWAQMGANAEDTAEIFKKLANATGDLDRAFGPASDTLKFKWNQLVVQAQVLMVELGDTIKTSIIPIFEGLMKKMANLINWWKALSVEQQKSYLKWAAIIIIAGPVIAMLGSIISAFGMLTTVIKGTIVVMKALTIATLANPWAATITALVAVASYFILTKNNVEKATVAIKAFNATGVKTTALVKVFDELAISQENLGKFNLRQVEEYLSYLQRQKMAEEDAGLAAEIAKKGVLDKYKLYGYLEKEWIKAKENGLNTEKMLFQQLKDMEVEYALDESIAVTGANIRIEVLKGYIAETEKLFADKKKAEELANKGKFEINPEVMDIAQRVAEEFRVMALNVQHLGEEYGTAEKKAAVFTKGIEDMNAVNTKGADQGDVWITSWKKGITDLGIAMESCLPWMDEFDAEMDRIGKLAKVFGPSFDSATPTIEALTEAINKGGASGQLYGKGLEIMKAKLAIMKAMMPGVLTVQQEYNNALDLNTFMTANLGSSLDEVSGRYQIQLQYLDELIKKHKDLNNVEVQAQMNVLKVTQLEMQKADLQRSIMEDLANGYVAVGEAIGTALGTAGANATSVFNAIIDSILQLAGAMLATTMAALMMRETINWGMVGLIVAGTAGLALIAALWGQAKTMGNSAAKMATGGMVPPGYNNDTFPALLSSGETVIPLNRLKDIGINKQNQQVVFEIEGRKLVGILQNMNTYSKAY